MSTPVRPRFTPHLLNMRRVEHTLAEQRDFTRAIKVSQHCTAAFSSLLGGHHHWDY
jgi:hypothetical protein